MKWGGFKDQSPLEHWQMLKKWWKVNIDQIYRALSGALVMVGFLIIIVSVIGSILIKPPQSIKGIVFRGSILTLFLVFLSRLAALTKGRIKKCPHCGIFVSKKDIICLGCREDLKKNCPSCGEVIKITAAECKYCGEKLLEIRLQEN